jgi:hypothetical protein
MKRSMWGITLLVAATGLWSCNGDPTGDLREGEKILADPASVFIDEGATKFVTVQLVDGQGNQLATDFAAQDVGSGITVEEDPTFLQTTINTRLPTQERFVVTGLTPAVSSFVVTAGDTSITIPVRVLPTIFGPTFSNSAPAQNEVVTMTAPAGFSFGAGTDVVIGADTAVVVASAEDGSTVSFVGKPTLDTVPGTLPVTVVGALSDLVPSVPLSIPAVDSITVPVAVTIPGSEAGGTAPAITAPPVGATAAFFDRPDFVSTIDHFYRIDVAEAGDYTITVDWSVGSDIDLAIGTAPGVVPCTIADCSDAVFFAATAAHPESGTVTLAAGPNYLLVEDFGGDAAGALVTITVTHLAASGGGT